MKYFNKINNLIKRLKFPIFVYCNIGLGIQAFVINTYLMKAKIEKRKILLINLYDYRPLISLGKIKRKANNEIFKIESPYFLFSNHPYFRKIINIFFNIFFIILFVLSSIINKVLFKSRYRIKKEYLQYKNYSSVYNLQNSKDFIRYKNDTKFWEEYKNADYSLELNQKNQKKALNDLENIGLPINAWYVCVHVRGNFWYQNIESNDIENRRNASIESFYKAFNEITKRGGYVLRLGDSSMDKLKTDNVNIIDYANSDIKSDFIDLHLIKNCKFFLCTMSGPLEVARLFRKPIAVTNIYHSCHWYPQDENCIGIMKKMYYKGNYLKLKQIFETYLKLEPIDFFNWVKLDSNINYTGNSEEEILDLVVEMFDMLEYNVPLTTMQTSLNKLIENTYCNLLNQKWGFGNEISDCNNKYQWFVWNGSNSGRLSNKFILNNI